MFILRKMGGENKSQARNFEIGNHYEVVDKERHPKSFEEMHKEFGGGYATETPERVIYAYVLFDGDVQPFWNHEYNFIMSENGKTFENITFR